MVVPSLPPSLSPVLASLPHHYPGLGAQHTGVHGVDWWVGSEYLDRVLSCFSGTDLKSV